MTVRYLSCLKCHRNDLSQHFRQCPACGKPVCESCIVGEIKPQMCLLGEENCDQKVRETAIASKNDEKSIEKPWWRRVFGL